MNDGGAVLLDEFAAADQSSALPAAVLRQVREAVGGTIGVVGGVGTLAGKILETAGDLLDAAAGILGGGVMLIGEVLDTTGEGIGMALSTVGRSVARAGDVVAGTNAGAENPESVVDAPPAPVTSGTRVRRAGTAPPKRAAKKPAPATR